MKSTPSRREPADWLANTAFFERLAERAEDSVESGLRRGVRARRDYGRLGFLSAVFLGVPRYPGEQPGFLFR